MSAELARSTLGGGCFWCLEAVFRRLRGVDSVISGYAGGHLEQPTYEQVCSGRTGHAEVVQITFDPASISFEELLYVFWRTHDPTTPNCQGADVGSQYRSIILFHDADQESVARQSLAAAEEAGLWPDPIVTEIVALQTFFPAESHHQEFFQRNPNQPYCRLVIDPKIRKLQKEFTDMLA